MLYSCLRAFAKVVILCLATAFCVEVALPTAAERMPEAKTVEIRLIQEATICKRIDSWSPPETLIMVTEGFEL